MTLAYSLVERREQSAPNLEPTVFVVDDDISVRESLELLIRAAGWRAQVFASAASFLATPPLSAPSCLVLDVGLPDVDGLEVQRRIAGDRPALPIIFMSGQGDVPVAVRAMKAGAMEFLIKPFRDSSIVAAIGSALERSRAALGRESKLRELRERYQSLSRREREVMALATSGRLNKQIAAEFRISVITVKAHRGKVMRKMQAGSLAELVQMAGRLRASSHD